MKRWIIPVVLLTAVAGLYLVEYSKIGFSGNSDFRTLDDLMHNEEAAAWEPFYRVRATLIDGQTARFSIPEALSLQQGEEMELSGAPVFFSTGCVRTGDSVSVFRFYLLPSPGLAEACVIEPDIEMRWTVRVHLRKPWLLHRDEMIKATARVKGRFSIDTSEPYDGVFFLEDAAAVLTSGSESVP